METKRNCSVCGKTLVPSTPEGLCPECLLKAGLPTGADLGPDTETGVPRTRFVPPKPEELAPLFPQLEILGLIGQGGMGAVYRARQIQLDRMVALKILPPGIGNDPAFAERFAREAKALARLNHPGIVTLYEFGNVGQASRLSSLADTSASRQRQTETAEAGGTPALLYFFLMEFVDGVNLGQLLRAGKLAPKEALAIVPQICDALQYAHDRGLVHRDIKPENILLGREGQVKVADFGLAKIVGADASFGVPPSGGSDVAPADRLKPELQTALTDAGRVMGTPQYMAPEQKERPLEVDHRADIYSLGVVLYQMLTGELPAGKFEPPSRKVQIDVRLDEVVLRALEKKPELRYQQASALKTQVESIVLGSAGVPPAEPGVAPGSTSNKFVHEPSGATPDGARGTRALPEPRFSRTAIVGACWLPFFFAAALLLLPHSVVVAPGQPPPGPAWWQILLMVTLFPLGLTAPFGTTILGWIAVSQIRHSAGKLHGLWLAVFDGLLFPLLALDALIVGGFLLGAVSFLASSDSYRTWASYWWLVLAAGFVALLLDHLIIRRVWRAVNQGGAGGDAQVPEDGKPSNPKAAELGKVLSPALMTVAWHAVLLLGMFGFFTFVVPQFVAEFSGLDAKLPRLTMVTLSLGSVISHGALILFPLLLALDAGICILTQYLAGRRLRNAWSALVVSAWGVLVLGAGLSFVLPMSSSEKPESPQDSAPAHQPVESATAQASHDSNHPASVALRFLAAVAAGDTAQARSMATTEFAAQHERAFVELRKTTDLSEARIHSCWKDATHAAVITEEFPLNGQKQSRGAMGISLVRAGNTWQIRDLDALPNDRARQRFEDKFHRAFPAAVSETVGLKFKPIPPSASERMVAYRDYVAAFLGENAGKPVDEETKQRFSKEAEARRQELEHLLQGTIAEPLMNQKQKIEAEMRLAAQAKDWGRISELTSQLGAVEVRLDEVVRGTTKTSAPAAAAPDATFGPVIERVVSSPEAGTHAAALNLESGELFGLPVLWPEHVRNLNEARPAIERVRASPLGMDIHLIGGGAGSNSVILLNLLAGPLSNEEFDTLSPSAVVASKYLKNNAISDPSSIVAHQGGPLTVLFRTRAGSFGLLQITGFTENPRGVKVRYKLVQKSSRS